MALKTKYTTSDIKPCNNWKRKITERKNKIKHKQAKQVLMREPAVKRYLK